MLSFRPSLALALGLAVLAAMPSVARARDLQPLMRGWEQHFAVTWNTVQRRGRLEIEGDVNDRSPYRVGRLRILVESVDARGQVVDQRISWVLGELGGDSQLYFRVPVSPAADYRVSVFSYDRIDEAAFLVP
ncbi:MAG TPA: hypothetical protein VNN07_05255 [Candidatus Tectomicrobia bacterium]|nr:hypothetical protein [Candidatus Tectomicrobia bacterium]